MAAENSFWLLTIIGNYFHNVQYGVDIHNLQVKILHSTLLNIFVSYKSLCFGDTVENMWHLHFRFQIRMAFRHPWV